MAENGASTGEQVRKHQLSQPAPSYYVLWLILAHSTSYSCLCAPIAGSEIKYSAMIAAAATTAAAEEPCDVKLRIKKVK